MNRTRLAGIGAILATAALWGTTGTAATFAPDAGPLAIGAAALGIGGLLQAVIAVPSLRRAAVLLRIHARLVILGAGAVAAYPLAFYSSMHLAGVAIGSVISLASAPLFSGLIELVIDRRPLGARWLASAALGIAGGVLLCFAEFDGAAPNGPATALGIALGLVAGLTYAAYSWTAQRLMGAGVPRSAAMGSVFGGGGLLLMPVLLITGAPLIASPAAFAVASYIALVPMFVGYVLFGYGLTKVPASTATTLTLAEPAVAAVLAVVIVGERLSATGWIGMSLFAAALLLLSTASAPEVQNTSNRADAARRRAEG